MGQTSYSNYHSAAVAGQVVEGQNARGQRGRYEGSEDLNFGRFVELHSDGELRQPQTAGATGKILGAIAYNASLPPGGYSTANDLQVPVFRKGQMWVEYTGTAPAAETVAKVMSSSTTATHRGKVTGDATSAVAGSEVYTMPGCVVIKTDSALSLALIEFNLPA